MAAISNLEGLHYGTMGLIEHYLKRYLEAHDPIDLEEAVFKTRTVTEELHGLSMDELMKDVSAASMLLDCISADANKMIEKTEEEEAKTTFQELHDIADKLNKEVERLFRERLEKNVLYSH